MYFANPWGLLGLLAVPAILAIHFFHRRYPPLVIAGAHLWGIDTEVQTIGRRFDRLPLSASLFLELLAALLLALLLSQPRLGVLGTARHLVVVLDHSASMQAAPPNGPAFREKALEALEKRRDELPAGSRVTVILSGPVPQTIAGPAERFETALLRLAEWKPTLPQHGFQPAWDRAAQFADTSGQMLFLTDHLPSEEEAVPEGMEILALGEPLRNVALTTAEWTYNYDKKTTQVYLRVANLGSLRVSAEVKAAAGEAEVFSKSLSIPAGSEEPLQFDVPIGTKALHGGGVRAGGWIGARQSDDARGTQAANGESLRRVAERERSRERGPEGLTGGSGRGDSFAGERGPSDCRRNAIASVRPGPVVAGPWALGPVRGGDAKILGPGRALCLKAG